jgi:hypothetical protein
VSERPAPAQDRAGDIIDQFASKVRAAAAEHGARPPRPGSRPPDALVNRLGECARAGREVVLVLKDYPRAVGASAARLDQEFQRYMDLLTEVARRTDLLAGQRRRLGELTERARARRSEARKFNDERTESVQFFRRAMGLPSE